MMLTRGQQTAPIITLLDQLDGMPPVGMYALRLDGRRWQKRPWLRVFERAYVPGEAWPYELPDDIMVRVTRNARVFHLHGTALLRIENP